MGGGGALKQKQFPSTFHHKNNIFNMKSWASNDLLHLCIVIWAVKALTSAKIHAFPCYAKRKFSSLENPDVGAQIYYFKKCLKLPFLHFKLFFCFFEIFSVYKKNIKFKKHTCLDKLLGQICKISKRDLI